MEESTKAKETEQRIINNIGLVFYIAKKLKVNPWYWDDCISEGMWKLFLAAKYYKPEKGVKFSTYAYIAIKRCMLNVLTERFPKFRQHVQLDEKWEEPEYSNNDLPEIPIKKLTKKEKIIIYMYFFEDMLDQEIAEKVNKSRQWVNKVKNNALKKLKDEIQKA